MLHYETVSSNLLEVLQKLSAHSELEKFRLVGGTSMSLQTGHRISIDIDLFTDTSFQVADLEYFVRSIYPSSQLQFRTINGVSFEIDDVKVDFYNWNVPFIKPPILTDNLRLASLEDIAAFKLDAITSRKEMKDYWDIGILLQHFSLAEMLVFYQQKYPYNAIKMVLEALSEFDKVAIIPIKSLGNETWQSITDRISINLSSYFQDISDKKLLEAQEKEAKLKALIERKKKL